MTDVRRHSHLAGAAVMLSLAWFTAGCGGTDTADPAPSFAVTPTAEHPPGGGGCGPDLALAIHSRSPGFGEIAVDRCQDGWAYLGAAEGMGDTEQLWRVESGAWRWVTSMPSTLCPDDLLEMGAPGWVVALFAYRDYDC